MRRIVIATAIVLAIATAAFVTACGGGDGGGGGGAVADTGLNEVTTSHANGQVATEGQVDAQGLKQGRWVAYWPDGSVLFEGHFVDGELDQSRDWIEYNRDGSTRFAQDDGPHPIDHPLAD